MSEHVSLKNLRCTVGTSVPQRGRRAGALSHGIADDRIIILMCPVAQRCDMSKHVNSMTGCCHGTLLMALMEYNGRYVIKDFQGSNVAPASKLLLLFELNAWEEMAVLPSWVRKFNTLEKKNLQVRQSLSWIHTLNSMQTPLLIYTNAELQMPDVTR